MRVAGGVVDDLRVDVLEALEDGQARTLAGAGDLAADALADAASCCNSVFCADPCSSCRGCPLLACCQRPGFDPSSMPARYLPAALPALRRMTSSEYLMPLPLYGSGSRSARISAAVCPTFCLSMPVMVMWPVLASTAMSMPSGIGEAHRMRVAELEDDFLPLDLGAVADADDVELALEAVGHAADVVRHERAHQAVEGARSCLSSFARVNCTTLFSIVTPMPGTSAVDRVPFGPLTVDGVAVVLDLDAFRQRDLFSSNSRHGSSPYQTWQRTSPPTPLLTASWPESTPLEVETMARPRPPSTRGISCLLR